MPLATPFNRRAFVALFEHMSLDILDFTEWALRKYAPFVFTDLLTNSLINPFLPH